MLRVVDVTCEGDGLLLMRCIFYLMFIFNVMNVKVPVMSETLEIKFKDKSIADVLNMTVDEGCDFFENISNIGSKLLL